MRGNSVSLPSKEPQNDRLGPVKDSPHKLTHGSLCYLCFMLIFLALVSALAISDKFLIFQDCLQWSSIPWDGFFFISLLSKLYNSNHLSLSTHLLVFAFLPLCWTWGRNPPGLLSPLPVHCPKLSPTALSILSTLLLYLLQLGFCLSLYLPHPKLYNTFWFCPFRGLIYLLKLAYGTVILIQLLICVSGWLSVVTSCISHILYPLMCWGTHRILPYLGYCE